MPGKQGSQAAQQRVSGAMAEVVVVELEIVDVDHQKRQRQAVAMGARHLLGEALVEVALVVQTGETVGRGEQLEAAVQAGVLDGDRGQRSEGRGELAFLLGEATKVALLDQLQAADHLVFEHQRHEQAALLAPPLHAFAILGRQLRIVDVTGRHAAFAEHPAKDRLIGEVLGRSHPVGVGRMGLSRPERQTDGAVLGGPVVVDVALPDVERLGRAAGDVGQHLVEHAARGDGEDDLGRHGETLWPGQNNSRLDDADGMDHTPPAPRRH